MTSPGMKLTALLSLGGNIVFPLSIKSSTPICSNHELDLLGLQDPGVVTRQSNRLCQPISTTEELQKIMKQEPQDLMLVFKPDADGGRPLPDRSRLLVMGVLSSPWNGDPELYRAELSPSAHIIVDGERVRVIWSPTDEIWIGEKLHGDEPGALLRDVHQALVRDYGSYVCQGRWAYPSPFATSRCHIHLYCHHCDCHEFISYS